MLMWWITGGIVYLIIGHFYALFALEFWCEKDWFKKMSPKTKKGRIIFLEFLAFGGLYLLLSGYIITSISKGIKMAIVFLYNNSKKYVTKGRLIRLDEDLIVKRA